MFPCSSDAVYHRYLPMIAYHLLTCDPVIEKDVAGEDAAHNEVS